jgi:hypothetical protein
VSKVYPKTAARRSAFSSVGLADLPVPPPRASNRLDQPSGATLCSLQPARVVVGNGKDAKVCTGAGLALEIRPP